MGKLPAWIIIAVILVCVAAIRIPLLSMPLERDEGEYAFAGQLLLEGIPPYEDAYNMKFPGIYAVYAAVEAVFGQDPAGIHAGLLLVNCASIVLIFLTGRKFLDTVAGLVAAAVYATISLSASVQGLSANAEHFVILAALGGILLLPRGEEDSRGITVIFSGLLLGLALVIKQHGLVFVILGGTHLYVTWFHTRRKGARFTTLNGLLFTVAALAPFLATCIILYLAGVFDRFWFWTFTYASSYVSAVPLNDGIALLGNTGVPLLLSSLPAFILAIAGFLSFRWDDRVRGVSLFMAMFLVLSILGTCPGFYFRPHYFILLLPVLAMFTGQAASFAYRFLSGRGHAGTGATLAVILTVVTAGYTLHHDRAVLFGMSPEEVVRTTFGANPFPESLVLAEFIEQNTADDSRIAVVGSEPQIYFYSNRRSSTGYIYSYALMEPHEFALQMQREMAREIEANPPEILVYVNSPASWLRKPGSHDFIFRWFSGYARRHYDLVGLAETLPDGETAYLWGEEAGQYRVQGRNWIHLLKRKEG